MIALDGCRTEPLGSYLQGLGAWRAIVRLLDADARARWSADRLELQTCVEPGEVVSWLVEKFEPLAIVSPWNKGSGFAGNGKSKEAERALTAVRESSDPRLAVLRTAVLAADAVVERGQQMGWGGKADELWDPVRKPDVVHLCRNMLPDAALPWIDTAVVLGQDSKGEPDLQFNRLLGTGGNFGRQELQATYVQRVLTVFADKRSAGWLKSALFGDESTAYLRESVGQFDPGRAGGIQSSPLEKRDDQGFSNPWSFLLTIEGALLFASAVTRRTGAAYSGAALPFLVRASGIGFGSAADGENASGEIWTPEWERFASLTEIEHLLGEGRADWNNGPAQNGLDFVRAVSALGVDRGVQRFTRNIFAERLGQNPLAVPVGVIDVRERPGVPVLKQLDKWLGWLRRDQSSVVQAGVHAVDLAMFTMGTDSRSDAVLDVLRAVGSLHESVARSANARERVKRPLILRDTGEWCRSIAFDRPEVRLAYALATSGSDAPRQDAEGMIDVPLRYLLTPVRKGERGDLEWSERPSAVTTASGVVAALAAAHARRGLPGAVSEPKARSDEQPWPEPAVRGVFSAFRFGPSATISDICDLALGRLDEQYLGELLFGMILFDRRNIDFSAALVADSADDDVVPGALAILLPFFADKPLEVPLDDDGPFERIVLRPGVDWLPQMRVGSAEHVQRVLGDAARRLRISGIRYVADVSSGSIAGDRLSAALMFRLSSRQRMTALRCVAAVSSQPRHIHDQQGVTV